MQSKTTHNCAPACQSVCQTIVRLSWSAARSMVASPFWLPPEEKMRTGTGDSLSRDRQNLVITLMLLVKQWNCFLERTLKVSDLFPSHPSAMHSIASHPIAILFGNGNAAKFAYNQYEGCRTWQLPWLSGKLVVRGGLCNISHNDAI